MERRCSHFACKDVTKRLSEKLLLCFQFCYFLCTTCTRTLIFISLRTCVGLFLSTGFWVLSSHITIFNRTLISKTCTHVSAMLTSLVIGVLPFQPLISLFAYHLFSIPSDKLRIFATSGLNPSFLQQKYRYPRYSHFTTQIADHCFIT